MEISKQNIQRIKQVKYMFKGVNGLEEPESDFYL